MDSRRTIQCLRTGSREIRPRTKESWKETETEIYYIIDGTASLVTGGVLDPPPPAPADPDVVRSRTIKNGLTRKVAKGDVIVVPPGTQHWFDAIDDTNTYLESRVRVK